jgi:hypothetical protein
MIQHDLAAIGLDQTYQHVKAGGFAGSVGTQQSNNFTALYTEANGLDDLSPAVRFGNQFGAKLHSKAQQF